MDKMFKRTLLGAAVATAAISGAVQAKPATDTVDLYGQVALSIWQFGEHKLGGGDAPINFENESRFGLRGSKELARGPKLIWQMEGGNVGDTGAASGVGVRDTFVGFEFDNGGKIRAGRLLTPTYEIIDWPYSGQRAGAIFDWGGDVIGGARYDRQSNMVRYDSANLGGFTFNVAAGRGTESDKDSNFYSLGGHFTKGVLTVHAGYEVGQDRSVGTFDSVYAQWLAQNPGQGVQNLKGSAKSDTTAAIIGFELHFDGFGINGAFKNESAEYKDVVLADVARPELTGVDIAQNSYSLGVYYSGVENWNFKMNYAANLDAELDSTEVKGSNDYIVSAQAMYFLDDSALAYVRPYMISKDDSDAEFGWGVGLEYYF
ncbi:porin [Vibrio sp. 05-20-BW147]|uniref:porin n=1 Tax=Vibrio sp. 05-20-BW147 TaxID=2575834 RepID=UPI001592F8A3|nr:porin [Vibrio sp. 05-20-BW147]NVC63740.1 porin [Vibrio sp. 05-20-BW147]